MDYFERFKQRTRDAAAPYLAGAAFGPKRPIPHLDAGGQAARVNQLVDLILGCQMMGLDFEAELAQARSWAEYEWSMVEPALAAKRAERAAA